MFDVLFTCVCFLKILSHSISAQIVSPRLNFKLFELRVNVYLLAYFLISTVVR